VTVVIGVNYPTKLNHADLVC